MNEEIESENVRIHSRADELIACLEGEIAKRDAELAACRVAVENCELFRARIVELEGDLKCAHSMLAEVSKAGMALRAELSALKAQEPVAEVKHGPLDSSGWPEFVRVKTIGDFDLENLPNGMKFYAAPVSEAKAQGDAWAPSVNDYDHSIHGNPDAREWADFFVATFPGLADKHDLMIGWFANAMMAMHDHLARKAQGVVMQATDGGRNPRYEGLFDGETEAQRATRLNAAPVQQVSVPDGWRLVKVGIEGVQFGNAWFSHEGITGYTADQLNSGNCRITGRAYMDWLYAAPAAPAADAGLVEALDYQVLFDAIAAATSVYANGAINISVQAFRDALAAHRAKGVV